MSDSQRHVNVAVVGLGFMGVTHLRAYLEIPRARITAVCDANRLPENGVLRGVAEIDEILGPKLQERTIAQLDPVERAALRIGVLELRDRIDVPARVVIDEGVGLCQAFGSEHSHSYVNAVLDAIARELRAVEMSR